VNPFYRYRPDGKPGREVLIRFVGAKLTAPAKLEIVSEKIHENIDLKADVNGLDSLVVLLPPEIGVSKEAHVTFILQQGKRKLTGKMVVPAMRHWKVFVYPHSHVDIGFSNTQAIVEFIHKRNIDEGIGLAEKTRNYPDGARYVWNTEVMWPVERYLNTATAGQKSAVLEAIKKGQLCPDASYAHVNTSTCSEEELIQLFRESREIEKQTGKPSDVLVQADIPGIL
jgi:hypothetical protein